MELGHAHWIKVAKESLHRALIGTYGKRAQRAAIAYAEKHPSGYHIEAGVVWGFYVSPFGDRRKNENHETPLFGAPVLR